MHKKNLLLYFLIASVAANVLGALVIAKDSKEVNSAATFDKAQQKYPLLSKRILQDFPQDVLLNFLDLRNDLKDYTAPFDKNFGVYFEYLPTGTSIGINATEEFHAASLFKLPVVMAYYHYKDRTGNMDDPTLTVKQDQIDSQFGDLWKKGPGAKIKASEAVDLALERSDNTAAKAIVPLVASEDFDSVYQGLDIDLKSDKGSALLTAKNYSSILKALYFSSVISRDSSEEILDKLTKTIFPDKLVAGVPQNILVAHKIGDYNDDKGNEAFMDCGIVYLSRRNYMLCMLSVSDEQTARERMQAVSKMIYDYVSTTP